MTPDTLSKPALRAPAKAGLWGWINQRLPVDSFMRSQLLDYYAPKNFNIWYFLRLAGAIGAGDAAADRHLPDDVLQGRRGHRVRLGRIHHARGRLRLADPLPALDRRLGVLPGDLPAHVPRMLYGSYKAPRELLWLFGMIIYLALMAEAFMGYVLPWGNMSYWAATVIINLFGTIPVIGPGWWSGSAATTASPMRR
jgi:ubiquinol-cytochrome c reductase cytochrome b subunit